MDFICTILGVVAGIAAIAVVGHGLWLIFVWLFRAISSPPNSPTRHTGESHPHPSTGAKSQSRNQQIEQDIQAANRLVDYARYMDWIPPEQYESLSQLLAQYRERIGSPGAITAPDLVERKKTGWQPAPQATQEASAPEPPAFGTPTIHPLEQIELEVITPATPPIGTSPQLTQPLPPVSTGPTPLSGTTEMPRASEPLSANLMRAFMEQANIRWIELVGASLLVACSIGLVISLWSTLSSTSRYFPSLVFLLATAAVHGAGQYTLRKWKLRSTSRGILHIGLMLIPLAVLVGILLSVREGEVPRLDWVTAIALAVGTLVYGAAAVTASRALFASRWLPVATAVIIGGLTLVPIHFLNSNGKLTESIAVFALVPMVGIGLVNALRLSEEARNARLRTSRSTGLRRRLATQVVQVLFAALIPVAFWITRSGWSAINEYAIAAVGLLLAGWASWGWSASYMGKTRGAQFSSALLEHLSTSISSSKASWFIIIAWGLSLLCAIGLAVVLWQTSGTRAVFAGFLLALCAWWIVHGLRCKLPTSLLAGSIAGILSLGLFGEWLLPDSSSRLEPRDWLSFSRVGSIDGVSVLVGLVGWILLIRSRSQPQTEAQPLSFGLPSFALSMVAGSGLTLLGTAVLAAFASLVPWSQPALGGNWASLLVLVSGAMILAVGIFVPSLLESNEPDLDRRYHWLANAILPIGQFVLLFGAIRLSQVAPMVPEWIDDLRMWRAWAVGGGAVAFVCAAIAAGLRLFGSTTASSDEPYSNAKIVSNNQFRIRWLTHFATFVVVLAAATYWTTVDRFSIASKLGWVIPSTLILSFVAVRRSAWREWSLIASAGWVVTLLVHLGWNRGWWESLGLATTTSTLALVVVLLLTLYEWWLRHGDAKNPESWMVSGHRWATGLLLSDAWTVVLGSLAPVACVTLWHSLLRPLTGEPSLHFYVTPLTYGRSSVILGAIVALGAFTYWLKSPAANMLRYWLATVPVALAVIVGCHAQAPHNVSVLLWVLAGLMTVLEILAWTNNRLGRPLASVRQNWASGKTIPEAIRWLGLTQGAGLMSLLLVTGGMLAIKAFDWLPAPLVPSAQNADTWSGWFENFWRLFTWMAPLAVLLALRWLDGLLSGLSYRWTTGNGYALGAVATLICAMAGAKSFGWSGLNALQGTAIFLSLIALGTIGYTAARNFLGLRHLDKKAGPLQLLAKAAGGSRWRESEHASWNLWLGAIAVSIALSAVATIFVVMFHPRGITPPVARLYPIGSWWTLAAVALTMAMCWLLGPRRGMPKFGLVAITLGLIAPVVSAVYGKSLLTFTGGTITVTEAYKPIRLLACLWLTSLAVGLGLRIQAALRDRKLSFYGEAVWVVLASIVGLVSLRYLLSDKVWASGELAVLALLIALSSEVSRQVWRGWIAAIVAMLAWFPWNSNVHNDNWIHVPWQTLLGATGAGLVAIAARWIFAKTGVTRERSVANVHATPRAPMAIDRIACLVASVLSIVLSGLWILTQPDPVHPSESSNWVVGGLALANLALAAWRLWDFGPSQRGLSIYLATIAAAVTLTGTASAHFVSSRYNTELGWLSAFLGAMALMALALREGIRYFNSQATAAPTTLSASHESSQPSEQNSLMQFFQAQKLADAARLQSASHWMASWHTIAALVCLVPSVWLVINMPEVAQRMAAIALPMLGAAAIWPLASAKARAFQRGSVLLLVSATLVLAWWSDLPAAWTMRGENMSWLFVHRAFLALVILSWLYPILAWRRSEDDPWSQTLMKGGWICLGIASFVGALMVGGMFARHWEDYPAGIPLLVKLLSVGAWLAGFARLLQFAARPLGQDRLANITTRQSAVYVAEIALVLAGATIYQHFPDLFTGWVRAWWPIVVMGIAFASIAIGQLLLKADQPILADPIHRSSLLLPLVPLAGVWWRGADPATAAWSEWARYALLLATTASLYGLYGWMRDSVALRITSAAAGLLSFWALLFSFPNMHFFQHPQFWLLPPALGVLAFVELNRPKLDATSVTIARYVCILVAYLSSSVEVFFKSMEGNLWQPLLLLALALCGIVAAIVLRVRAFLYCGVAFFAVALIGMVLHAAQAINQTWPWWAFGIGTAIGIFILLGYFEKNRPKVLKYLEGLKQWQN